ncbi:MAG: hypothetical protein K2X66_08970 [Cyanobacteria bacterium]|nr:hypothetical protein [Cyanobacteriota bacterium]
MVSANPRVLEIGCSSGTSTKPMIEGFARFQKKQDTDFPFHNDEPLPEWLKTYDAIDIDQGAIHRLNGDLKKLRDEKSDTYFTACSNRVQGLVADAMRHMPKDKAYTHAVMQFALSHFDADGKSYLLDHLKKIMDLGGVEIYAKQANDSLERDLVGRGAIIITDEFLPRYKDELTEQEALGKHHGAVIYDAMVKGNRHLAELELEAMYSGLHKIGDFKTSCHEFEDVLWRKGMEFSKFKTFPIVGDMVPHDVKTPPEGATPKELKANQIWQENYRALFEVTRDMKPTPNNFQLPQKPRELLHQLIQKYSEQGLNGLRPTPKPGDIEISYADLEKYNVTHQPESEDKEWGVYTYKIVTDVNHRPIEMRHRELSALGANQNTPDQMADEILNNWHAEKIHYQDHISKTTMFYRYEFTPKDKNLEFILSILDDIDRPADRWHASKGESIPTYKALQDPLNLQKWQEKVDFTKAALKKVVTTLLAENPDLQKEVDYYTQASQKISVSRAELARVQMVYYTYYPG